jgi:polar amino acid transport system substrate-binding protein
MLKIFFICCLLVPCTSFEIIAQELSLNIATLEYPPFIVQNNNKAEGEIAETVREIFIRLGYSTNIKFYPAARGLAMLSAGNVDAMFTLKKNKEREKTMLFPSQPLLKQDFVFFVRNDSNIIYDGNLSSLFNERIGIVNQTSYGRRFDDALGKELFKKIEVSQSFENNFQKLIAGRMDVVINSRDVGISILKKIGAVNKVKITGPPIETVFSYLAFSKKKDYKHLSNEFDKTLLIMKKDGTIDRIHYKYLH